MYFSQNQYSHNQYQQQQQQPQPPQQQLQSSGIPPGPGSATSVSGVDSSNSQLSSQNAGPQQQGSQQQSNPNKELNAASLCRFGQETVQEIVSRTLDVFQTLKAANPPDGKQNPAVDRKPKVQETLKNIRALFKRLKVIYEKLEEGFPASEDSYYESSLPFKDGREVTVLDEKKNTDAYRTAVEEYRDMIEHLVIKNRHLKETVDHLRHIIWDINTMLAMRKE